MTTTWTAVEERIAWTATEDPSYQFVTLRPTTVTLESGGGGGGAVDSVNGQTGVVVLDAGDIAVDASGFSGNLDSGDTDVQAVADAVDALTLGSGSGDVVGPASSTNGAVAVFGDTSGKLLADGVVLGTAAEADTGDFDAAGTAAGAVSTHAGATDPHGDRAYADGLVNEGNTILLGQVFG